MQIEEVQARLRLARAQIRGGRFAFTMSEGGDREEAYLTHWFYPEPGAFEDCKAVGSGTVEECLAALDRYVASVSRSHAPILMAAE